MNDTLLSTLSSSSAETTEAIVVDSKYPYALGIFMFAAVLLDLWLLLLVLNKLQQRKARLCCTGNCLKIFDVQIQITKKAQISTVPLYSKNTCYSAIIRYWSSLLSELA